MRVLIVGVGIAGPTLAYWLPKAGDEPTLVERTPRLRRGGYLVDFWGAALAMVESSVLAAELHRSASDHEAAFAAYERQLAALVRGKQDAAIGLGVAFAPRNRRQVLLRNTMLGLMGVPVIANIAMGRSLRDPIRLPPWAD